MLYFRFLLNILMIYLAANALVFFLSDRSLFVPPISTYKDSNEIIKIHTSNGRKISALYLKNPNAKYVIIYSHGNAEDLGMIKPTLKNLYDMGFSVIGYDYQGYGTSNGRPSENATYDDISAVYDYLLRLKIKPSNIILFGRSLGSGPSIELATQYPVAGIILEGAFTSAYRVVTQYPVFLFDKYNNIAKIDEIDVPILLIHGTNDNIVPQWHSQKIYDVYQGPKQYYWIENGGHNDIDTQSADYKSAIISFVKTLPPSTSLR